MSKAYIMEALLELRDAGVVLTPENVKEAVREAGEAHPLYKRIFDVPAGEAAERYYTANARRLLQVEYKPRADAPSTLRAFWTTKEKADATSVYETVAEIMEDPMKRQIMLRQMNREWENLKDRYKHMREFWDLVQNESAEQAS